MMTETKTVGIIKRTIEYRDGRQETISFPNTSLTSGKSMFAKTLANLQEKPLYIAKMLFGDGGVVNQKVQEVRSNRQRLFGITRVNKAVTPIVDPKTPTQVAFVAVIEYEEGNDQILNEMALELSNGDLFSMAAFHDLHKTDDIKLQWTWQLSFV